jgi:hypothetical protein
MKMNLPGSLIAFMWDPYENISTRISKRGESTSEIEIGKDVRQ